LGRAVEEAEAEAEAEEEEEEEEEEEREEGCASITNSEAKSPSSKHAPH